MIYVKFKTFFMKIKSIMDYFRVCTKFVHFLYDAFIAFEC